ncbi:MULTISPECIES: hypothetical protein [unclassified Natrinema]|uniref:Uncharacterized protein n=1 Tax=Saline Natrinema sp. J7-1 virus 2 TaxID=2847286 RepID=A0A976SFC1_9VIRU|nr:MULTISPECIES: hypothetical protein [unclassified Natrinema]YP_010772543.1 hypothetical protein QIT43_gp20 [Saline Natrinema sp. J7-1 virus 2]AFO55974.1 hypothetical protein NJ7G_0718 [Natrinema sp. J7-2]UUT36791.1 hypothetical protein SNJ2_gp20 [Saline Natrinema sp. J7-1 virus 2]
MADLTAFGLEPQDSSDDDDDDDGTDEPVTQWPECVDCGYDGPEVKTRLNQSVPLCTACFAEREGLL